MATLKNQDDDDDDDDDDDANVPGRQYAKLLAASFLSH